MKLPISIVVAGSLALSSLAHFTAAPESSEHGDGQGVVSQKVQDSGRMPVVTLTRWLVKHGERIRYKQPIAEIMTNGGEETIEAPFQGRFISNTVEEDSTIRPKQIVGFIKGDDDVCSWRGGPKIRMRSVALRHALAAYFAKLYNYNA